MGGVSASVSNFFKRSLHIFSVKNYILQNGMELITLKPFMLFFVFLKPLGMPFNSCVVNKKKPHLQHPDELYFSELAEMWKYISGLSICEK